MKEVIIFENDEIIDRKMLKDDEEIYFQGKKKELTPKQIKIINDKISLKKYCSELGGFVHMLCIRNNLLFNELNIERQNISRIIYLSTFIDFNTNQENLLVRHGKNYKIQPLTRNDIKRLLRLEKDAFNQFMKDMKKNGLMYEANEKFYLSDKYFTKGKSKFDTKEYTRVFIDTTRFLYEHTTTRQHNTLSYVYQLIPYMNYELNIICSNPLEKDVLKLNKMSLKEICEMLGLKTDRKTLYKFRETLRKFYIKVDDRKYYVFAHNTIRTGKIIDYYVVNPMVIWGGNNTDKMKEIIKICFFQ